MARSATSFTSERTLLAEAGCELHASAERYFDEQIVRHHRAIESLQAQKHAFLRRVREINADIDVPAETGRSRMRVHA